MWGIIFLVVVGLLLLLIVANFILSRVKKRKSLDNKKGDKQ